MASGAIPWVMQGVRDIPGATPACIGRRLARLSPGSAPTRRPAWLLYRTFINRVVTGLV